MSARIAADQALESGGRMLGYNFTENVRRALALAREESLRMQHECVGTEHILLGLMDLDVGAAHAVLQALGADTTAIRATIESTVGREKGAPNESRDLPYTSRAKKVLELALAEVRELGHPWLGSEHLLLGLLREERGIGAQVLMHHGVTSAKVRTELQRMLDTGEVAYVSRPDGGSRPTPTREPPQPITGAEYVPGDATLRNVLAQFYAAFNSRDLDLMATSWSQTPDVMMYNPLGGIARGWDAIRAVYARIFEGPARVRVAFHDYTLYTDDHLFYAIGQEHGTLERDGREVALAIRTTRLFRRHGATWRQVHHHGSIDDPELLKTYQELVSAP